MYVETTLTEAPRKRGRGSTRRVPLSLLVHAAAFSWFARVWLWHFTPAASQLPGAIGFGWFFRFLTFFSYTLQTLTLGLATLDDLTLLVNGKSRLTRHVDNLACAIFALTHVVSIMFYTIQSTTKAAVEGGHIQRPPWLDLSVHAFNTLVAWADLLTSSQRTFSKTSERLSMGLVAVYLHYILLCRHMNGRFPYPFLNMMPMPHGFIFITGACLLLFVGAFRCGKLLNRKLTTLSVSISVMETQDSESEEVVGFSSKGRSSSSSSSGSVSGVIRGGFLLRSRRRHC